MQAENSYSPSKSEFSYKGRVTMKDDVADPVRDLIRQLLRERGLDAKAVSLAIGRNHAYLQQFLKRGIPRNLPEDVRHALASYFQIEQKDLGGVRQVANVTIAPPRNARLAGQVGLNVTVPAYGQARGGKDGQFPLNGNKVADVLAPPSLANVPDAYAVYVVGSSMEPRYYPGECVFVNPKLPIMQGCFVVAQIAAEVEGDPPLAYVKRYVSSDSRILRLEQFSPRKTLTFPANRVVSLHRIIMGGMG
jgi:phage repressor protein C with HTH and peptisase S24 domain